MDSILFYLFAGIVAAGAVGVAASRNIIRTAVYLLFALMGVAGIYLLLGAKMHFEPTLAETIIAALIGGVLLIALCAGLAHLPEPAAAVSPSYSLTALGASLLGEFVIPFELISILLLVVMIGAAYLGKGRRDKGQDGKAGSGEQRRTARENAKPGEVQTL
jgi:NADH-quinone oxidoreductase subunit J